MVESFKNKRAIFTGGKQREFLETVERKLSVQDAARVCLCSTRTIRDWRREKIPMRLDCLYALCKSARINVPRNFVMRDTYAHASRAGMKGWHAIVKKYGRVPVDEPHRKHQWQKWWQKIGQFRKQPTQFYAKSIYKPAKSVELAEFIGTMMGDGGMHKY